MATSYDSLRNMSETPQETLVRYLQTLHDAVLWKLDGLSEYGIWARIMVPLSIPAIASLTLLTFVATWNDYLGPLIYLRNPDLWTIQLGLQSFVSTLYDANYALLFAGLVISVVPIAVIFLLGQKYFVEGIAGAVKS